MGRGLLMSDDPRIDLEALAVTRQVTAVLDALGVPYVIGGSLTSMAHGMMRSTTDADIVADLQPDHASALIEALGDRFYIPDETVLKQAIEQRGSFNLIHLATMFKVDVFLSGMRPFDRQQLQRRVGEQIGRATDETVWGLSAENVVLSKLEWFHAGGEVSERQWRDVLGVIKGQARALDRAYLREWATALQVSDLLEWALAEGGSDAV